MNFIGIPYVLFFGIVYCVCMCAVGSRGVDIIIISVPESSDSCQNTEGEACGNLKEGRHFISIFSFTPVIGQFWFMDFFQSHLASEPQLYQTQNLSVPPLNLALYSLGLSIS